VCCRVQADAIARPIEECSGMWLLLGWRQVLHEERLKCSKLQVLAGHACGKQLLTYP
jgi:hypothetical protein